jgi:3-oxoacyl-[acyl-carrier protein] reductase
MSDLAGKVALVVGGSGGIGGATVRRLAARGATVFLGYHQGQDRAAGVLADLPGTGHRSVRIAAEDRGSITAAAELIKSTVGRLDILVNAAGFSKVVPHNDLDALDDALFDSVLITNVRGPFAIIRALRPLLKASGDGVIVNVSSISAFTGSGSNIAYCAAKAALDTMTLSLARVLGPEIRILNVSPGAVATDFLPGRDRAALEKIAAATPRKRVVEPDDVARAIVAAVTDLPVTTGAKIVVDGGRFLV